MEGSLPMTEFGEKNKPLSRTWDKSLAPAIPPKLTSFGDVLSLTRTIIRAPLVTGGNPSASTEAFALSSRPQKSIHPEPNDCDYTARSSLCIGQPELLLFLKGFVFEYGVIIARFFLLSILFEKNFQAI